MLINDFISPFRIGKCRSTDSIFLIAFTGVPFIPSIKKIERKQCGIKEVSWEASSSESGGGSVTEFQVQMEQGGDWRNCSRFLPNNTCSFHGLLIDKSDPLMNVRVRAFNRKGFSDWTNTSISLSHEGK